MQKRSGTGTFDGAFDQGFNQGILNSGTSLLSGTGAATTPEGTPKAPTAHSSDAPTFVVPGGFGAAPKTITPGEGDFARPPISFGLSLQQGYTDNVYTSSGKNYPDTHIPATTEMVSVDGFTYGRWVPERIIPGSKNNPIVGSWISEGSGSVDILLAQSRMVLSMNLNAGASYYWHRGTDPFSPVGGGSLMFAYKASPRLQISAGMSAGYQTQPDLNAVSGVTQSSSAGYWTANMKWDIGYAWTARVSTVTTVDLGLQDFASSGAQNNFTEPTYGESLRYALSARTTAVAEARYGTVSYTNSINNSDTEYFLGGFDLTFSSRCTATFRGGSTVRNFSQPGTASASSPYGEANVDYGLGRAMALNFSARYGFEEGGAITVQGTNKTFRTNLSLREAFSTKFTASINVGFSNQVPVGIQTTTSSNVTTILNSNQPTQNTVGFGLNGSYQLTHTTSLFGNFSRSQLYSKNAASSYSSDMVFMGVNYQF